MVLFVLGPNNSEERKLHCNKILSFLEGCHKFPAPRWETILFDPWKCFQFLKFFICHQNWKLLHSGNGPFCKPWKAFPRLLVSPVKCMEKSRWGKGLGRNINITYKRMYVTTVHVYVLEKPQFRTAMKCDINPNLPGKEWYGLVCFRT